MKRKHNARARESMAHWADLRSGDMYQGDEKTEPKSPALILLIFAMVLITVGLIASYALGDVPEKHVPERGFEVCKGSC